MNHHSKVPAVEEEEQRARAPPQTPNLTKLDDFVSRCMGKMKPLRDELPYVVASATGEPATATATKTMNHHSNKVPYSVEEEEQRARALPPPQTPNLTKLDDFVSRCMGKMKPLRDELPSVVATATGEPSTATATTKTMNHYSKVPYSVEEEEQRARALPPPQTPNLMKLDDFVGLCMGKVKPLRDELPSAIVATATGEPSTTATATAVAAACPKNQSSLPPVPPPPPINKRPLSAYNIFFQRERDRILLCNRGSLPGRRHRHTPAHGDSHNGLEGRMSFAELARTIARTWRKLDGTERQYYQSLADKEEKRRCERELAERELAEYHRRRGGSSAVPAGFLKPPPARDDDDRTRSFLLSSDAAASSSSSSHRRKHAKQEDTSPKQEDTWQHHAAAVASTQKKTTTASGLLEVSPLGFGYFVNNDDGPGESTTKGAAATNVDLQGNAVPPQPDSGAFWSDAESIIMAQSLEQLSELYSKRSKPLTIQSFQSEEEGSSSSVGGKTGGDALLRRPPASCPAPIATAPPVTGDALLLLPSSASAGGAVPLNEAADFFFAASSSSSSSSSWRRPPTTTNDDKQHQEEEEEEEEVLLRDDCYDPLSILPEEAQQQGEAYSPPRRANEEETPQQQRPPPRTATNIDLDSDMRDILTQLLESD